jgi:hypothetical protein
MRSRIANVLAALTVAAGAVTVMGAPAYAAAYDGQDPRATGCRNGSYVAKSKTDRYTSTYGNKVWVQANLWYSPSCRTVWAVVNTNVTNWSGLGCNVWRNSDNKRMGCAASSGTQERYSMMLNDANVTSYATGWGYDGNDPHQMYARTDSY